MRPRSASILNEDGSDLCKRTKHVLLREFLWRNGFHYVDRGEDENCLQSFDEECEDPAVLWRDPENCHSAKRYKVDENGDKVTEDS